jgi:cytidylate kinase
MKKIVIAVSGPPGAGSTTISKLLARRLQLKYFSPGLVQKKLAREKNQTKAAVKTWKMKLVRTKEFHKNLDKMQIDVARKGNVVICGKLSFHFLKDLADYKIWLDVPLRERAKRAAGRDKIPVEESERLIAGRQRTERKEFKRIYGFDYLKQKLDADLILDSTGLTPKQTVGKIIQFIKKSRYEK